MKSKFFFLAATALVFATTLISCKKETTVGFSNQLNHHEFVVESVRYGNTDITGILVQQDKPAAPEPIYVQLHVNSSGEQNASLVYTSIGNWNTVAFEMFKGSTASQVSIQFEEPNGSNGVYVGNTGQGVFNTFPQEFLQNCKQILNYATTPTQAGTCPQGYYWNGVECVAQTTNFYFDRGKLSGVYDIEEEATGFVLSRSTNNKPIKIRLIKN
jgi:hypothetical protein